MSQMSALLLKLLGDSPPLANVSLSSLPGSSEEPFVPYRWESCGGFMLYFVAMCYVFLGFEVCSLSLFFTPYSFLSLSFLRVSFSFFFFETVSIHPHSSAHTQLICGHWFVPALNVFCEQLGMSDDFAGATLMALGGNAPDIFSGVAGVLVLQSDVGTGTIVGSLIFNHLCIIGCTVLAVRTLLLDLKLLTREVVFYTFAIILMFVSLYDCVYTPIYTPLPFLW